jgi:hypothetical protein
MSKYFSFTAEQDVAFFGPAPLLQGEDARQYNQLLNEISTAVEPADIFELAFVRTIVNLIWESNRYRRLVAGALLAAEQEALEGILTRLLYDDSPFKSLSNLMGKPKTLSHQYVLKQQAAVVEVDHLLASAGMDWEVVKAEAFSLRQREIESLSRMIAGIETRMKTTLREIERHRKGFGQQLRRVVEQLDDGAAPLSKGREELKRAA